jgi:hypothetical protein
VRLWLLDQAAKLVGIAPLGKLPGSLGLYDLLLSLQIFHQRKMDSIRLREYRSANASSLLRQPTLESQRGGVKNLRKRWERLFRPARTLDDFEKTIQAIQQRTKIEETKDLSDLSRDYPRLKLRHGAEISQCLVWYKDFVPIVPRPLAACKMNFLAQQI